ncbi:MAG: CBS domain-containing protein [Chloroflexi bacterium]|nr:CBS domain-containing protein [Chloroflexota bacterium]
MRADPAALSLPAHIASPPPLLTRLRCGIARLSEYVRIALDRWQPPETGMLIVTAIFVGIGTGLMAVIFIRLIDLFTYFFFEQLQPMLGGLGVLSIVLIPVLGGLLGGPLITFVAREAKGHGVPEVMQAIALQGGRMRPIVAGVKAVASSICIGSGGSVGREGPIVQIGAVLGSVLGQAFRLSDERIRNLVACGTAAGIAAVFNAPIAGSLFALEVILGEFTTSYFGSVVVCAVAASVVSRHFLGTSPAFVVPAYTMVSAWEVLPYALLGLGAGVIGWGFVTALYGAEDIFDNWRIPEYLKPAVGGLLLGLLALYLPQTLGTGLSNIEKAIQGEGTILFLGIMVLAKMLGTSFTLGSGNSGGVFAPGLFMGAMFGGAFGHILHPWFPTITAGAGAYALVGMAAVFAAAAHAPITAILIVFEMSGDYRLILPLMLATVLSSLVSEKLRRDSIYTLKLSRRGVHLERGRDIDVMRGVLVGEAMSANVDTVTTDMTLAELRKAFLESHHHGFPVLDSDGKLFGVVTIQDLARAEQRPDVDSLHVRDIATTNILTATPDEPIWLALRRLGTRDVGRLPVVDRFDRRRLLGAVRRYDIIKAYQTAILRRVELQERTDQLRLGRLTGTDILDILIHPESPVIGKKVCDVELPENCVLISIRRGQNVQIVRGNTVIEANDRVTALVESTHADELRMALNSGLPQPPDDSSP